MRVFVCLHVCIRERRIYGWCVAVSKYIQTNIRSQAHIRVPSSDSASGTESSPQMLSTCFEILIIRSVFRILLMRLPVMCVCMCVCVCERERECVRVCVISYHTYTRRKTTTKPIYTNVHHTPLHLPASPLSNRASKSCTA
jgi:hypothetical protein